MPSVNQHKPRKRKPLERTIERAAVKKLRDMGCKLRKLNGMGYRSWPDQLVLPPWGVAFFIEFKRPGEKPTEDQTQEHRELRAMGYAVYVCDSVVAAIDAYDERHGWTEWKAPQ